MIVLWVGTGYVSAVGLAPAEKIAVTAATGIMGFSQYLLHMARAKGAALQPYTPRNKVATYEQQMLRV
jgi:hypothetical protein